MTPPHLDLKTKVVACEGRARATTFQTPHGEVKTPAFFPVGTRASVKGLTNDQIEAIGPEGLLANTYHLHLRPGESVVERLGGLHAFTGWSRPLLTDSGGYQVFSLSELTRIEERGVRFKSHLDGRELFLGPAEAMRIQEALGADIVMAFDHCIGLPAPRADVEAAVDRTTRWTRACADARTRDDQALFGIVQGGTDPELRARSATDLVALDLPGYAIGGLAVGEGPQALRSTLSTCTDLLPEDKPRYLMGVGRPIDLLDAIHFGVDFFDCVLPTRNGRRGWLLTHDGTLRVASRAFRDDDGPLDPDCSCPVCKTHSRAYLRHLFHVEEHLAFTLGSLHNTHFLVDLVRRARTAIKAGTFESFREEFTTRWSAGETRWKAAQAADPEGAQRSRVAQHEDHRGDPSR